VVKGKVLLTADNGLMLFTNENAKYQVKMRGLMSMFEMPDALDKFFDKNLMGEASGKFNICPLPEHDRWGNTIICIESASDIVDVRPPEDD
jgi:hypothetical protein